MVRARRFWGNYTIINLLLIINPGDKCPVIAKTLIKYDSYSFNHASGVVAIHDLVD